MAKSKKPSVNRRGFLKGAAIGAAALVAKPGAAEAQAPAQAAQARPGTTLPSASLAAAETSPPAPRADVHTTDRPGSDYMVDVIKSLNFEYIAANPGSTFRALHESIINYGGNTKPELLTCMHEESSVAMGNGGEATSNGRMPCRIAPRWSATTRSGTTRRYRSRALPNLRFALTKS